MLILSTRRWHEMSFRLDTLSGGAAMRGYREVADVVIGPMRYTASRLWVGGFPHKSATR